VTAYALISYRTAYLRTHYPEVYFPLLVAGQSGYFSSDVYRLEARRLGVDLGEPEGPSGEESRPEPRHSDWR